MSGAMLPGGATPAGTPAGGEALPGAGRMLAEALDAEQAIYRSMLGVAQREQRAILDGDVAALTELVEEHERLIEHLNALETERMTALVAIAAATGVDAEATLTEVASRLPAPEAALVTGAGIQLRAQAMAMRDANVRNAELLRNSREVVERWIQYMKTLLSGSLYTANGGHADGGGARSLDRSA